MGFTKEEAKQRLSEVISRFKRWQKEGRLNNEDDIKDLTQELFEKVLGWDKDDIYRERHPGPTSKRVDLQFRVNGAVKLLLETKAIDVPWDKTVLRQAIGYGWGSNEEYVILTNFQKIILFNAKWKDEDKKIFGIDNIEECLTSEQKLEFLLLLGKESFETGKIDEFSEATGKKFKKLSIATIEEQLLHDLRKWRELLTNNIKTLNKLSVEEIDDTVQKIINRLIFIRVCEDRGLEPEFPELRSHLRIWSEKKNKTLIEALVEIFHHFDDVYDGTIFQKNDLCERVNIHNSVLERIIEELYVAKDMNTEYNFSSINADVLGSVYEQYLGYLLRGKKVSESNAHKKESGIYYTPTYIVDYIVRNTLGEVLKQKKDIDKIKVLDPACGSGSFLIKTFDVFSDFWKSHIGEDKFDRQIKNNILTHNIYGVDLDPKAVEISQLNLFLKIGEKGELPKLRQNIRCGNSLIDDDTIAGNKAFNWNSKFKEIMDGGGFDVIIGNPPYGATFNEKEKRYYDQKYTYVKSVYESYRLFIEQSIKLLKKGGYLGFIVPNTWFYLTNAEFIRKELLTRFTFSKIINLPQSVFEDATIDTCIIILKNVIPKNNQIKTCFFPYKDKITTLESVKLSLIKQEDLLNTPFSVINLKMTGDDAVLISKIKKQPLVLNDYVKIITGIKPYQVGKGNPAQTKKIVDEKPFTTNICQDSSFKPWLTGKFIFRYGVSQNKEYIKYGQWLAEPKIRDVFEVSRIVLQQIRNPSLPRRIVATLIRGGIYTNNGIHNLLINDKNQASWILGILNSKLMNFYFAAHFNDVNIKPSNLYDLPYPRFAPNSKMPILVNRILSLNEKMILLRENNTDEKIRLKNEIEGLDHEIDEEVYKLYDLTDEEKKIIEETF